MISEMRMGRNFQTCLLDDFGPRPGRLTNVVMHILHGNTACSADLGYRSSSFEPQDATQVMIPIRTRIARLRLRMEAVLVPKIP
jgi:hypothetical protein